MLFGVRFVGTIIPAMSYVSIAGGATKRAIIHCPMKDASVRISTNATEMIRMADKVKHTEGPWEVGDLDKNGQRIVRAEHIEIATCWHHCVGSIEKEMEAN